MEKVEWKVEGMTCTNCALTINRYLQKEGLGDVQVNFIGKDVSFDMAAGKSKESIAHGIENLGYHVVNEDPVGKKGKSKRLFTSHLQRFAFCVPFTLLLLLHMLPVHIHFLMNPWIQLAICLPVYLTGMSYFGVNALKSLRHGIPNMNLLIALGATAAFIYSLIGTARQLGPDYVFYETAATIITLVFLGEWIEQRSVAATQKELDRLGSTQTPMANMIAFDEQHQELVFPVETNSLRSGDLVLVKTGEQVPADCKILWGEASVNESLLTGESLPVFKQKKDSLIGGSILTNGTVKAQVTAAGKDTVLSGIISMVKKAQNEKPPVQQLADRISAVFVPVVIGLALLTFLLNYYAFSANITGSLMRSIAVLVISCPCAMGLATPAAVAVGLGRAAANGILFRDARSLEQFRHIDTVVFDKTGTLTTGEFEVVGFECYGIDQGEFKRLVFSLEKYSSHPLAISLLRQWKTGSGLPWKKIEEIKGLGMKAESATGDIYLLGSGKMSTGAATGKAHTMYLFKNEQLLGWIDMEDQLRPGAQAAVQYLHNQNKRTLVLSGDSEERTRKVASLLGIQEVQAEKSPAEKLAIVEQLNSSDNVAMVGDGINDAPAMAKASLGIALSSASQLAVQSAGVVLINNNIGHLPMALGLGKQTYQTIRQNLFWAFIYNVVAIPVAAMGFLNPGIAALAMGFSDVVLAVNSIRLKYRSVT